MSTPEVTFRRDDATKPPRLPLLNFMAVALAEVLALLLYTAQGTWCPAVLGMEHKLLTMQLQVPHGEA